MSHRLQINRKLISSIIPFLLFFSPIVFSAPGNFYLGGSLDESIAWLAYRTSIISYFSGTEITDNYAITQSHHGSMLLSINGGYQFAGSKWVPATSFGLGIYRTINDYNVSGAVTESMTGNSDVLYNYNYNIKQWIAMAQVKLTWNLWQLAPFVDAGLGPSWNELTNYHEIPVYDSGFSALAPFQARITTNVAYEAGLGVGYDFNFNGDTSGFEHERAAIGYRYMNFGNVSFGTRNGDYPYSMNLGRMAANDFYLSFTHLF